ncbi:MAG: DUF3575 domain-containing protein [Bacteroidales bacterium]|nr:DUF3575 domain-containing protein [Bacteroidales bacterium]
MRKIFIFSFVLACMALFLPARAQNVGIKTNILYDAALSPNLGVEIGLAPRWTLDISGNVNAWTVDNRKWKHWLVQPEARYWLCERFQGNFFGLHLLGGQYNVGNIGHLPDFLGSHFSNLKDHRYQGWGAGAGIAYGHAWVLGKHWNLEAEIGIGWIYTRYDVYPCATCGTKQASNKVHNYVGPTKAALNLVYLF